MANCDCQMWLDNIDKLNEPLLFLAARNPGKWQYEGAPFEYCPWCGASLWRDWTDSSVPEAYRNPPEVDFPPSVPISEIVKQVAEAYGYTPVDVSELSVEVAGYIARSCEATLHHPGYESVRCGRNDGIELVDGVWLCNTHKQR